MQIDQIDLKELIKGINAWDENEEAAQLFKMWLEIKHYIKNYELIYI